MTPLRYHLLDVFTRRPFGGNQLAVFTDAASIDPDLMPRIARELNLSETVFVLPPTGSALARLRIFTPGAELPFAGHPTVGTACLMASLGTLGPSGPGVEGEVPAPEPSGPTRDRPSSIVFEEGVGDVHVLVRVGDAHAPSWAQLTAAQVPDIRPAALTTANLAALLGVGEADIGAGESGGPETAAASCGVPFLFIPLRSREALARCRLNITEWDAHLAHTWAPHVFAYMMARDAHAGTSHTEPGYQREPDAAPVADIHGRMFAPAMGITEDPATGAAATALAGLLAQHAPARGTHRWTLSQGVEMGRPSMLELEADANGDAVTACRVGGHAIVVGRGELLLG